MRRQREGVRRTRPDRSDSVGGDCVGVEPFGLRGRGGVEVGDERDEDVDDGEVDQPAGGGFQSVELGGAGDDHVVAEFGER